jgi:hypothetical protein
MLKILVITSFLLHFLAIHPALASTSYIDRYIPQAQKVGEARLTVMFWDVYDASLFAPNGQWAQQKPFALKLSYLRDFKGEDIADRSVKEMRKQGFDDEVKLATWHTQMRQTFPDVQNGDQLTGIYTSNGHTLFYKGDKRVGTIKDPEFGKQFFAIWLGPETSIPSLRYSLLGYSNTGNDDTVSQPVSYKE